MMKAGTAIVHIVPFEKGSPGNHALPLTEEERRRAASFRFEEDAVRWSAFRAQLRRILASVINVSPLEVPIILTPQGKPVLGAPFEGLHFSLSHCEDLALIALCADGVIGVDVEPASRVSELSGCEQAFCHPSEIEELPVEAEPRHRRLMEIWSAKEALLKALGTGLTHPPETVRMCFNDGAIQITSELPLPGIESMRTLRLHHPALVSHIAALSVPDSVMRVDFIAPEASTSSSCEGMIPASSVKAHG